MNIGNIEKQGLSADNQSKSLTVPQRIGGIKYEKMRKSLLIFIVATFLLTVEMFYYQKIHVSNQEEDN